eukprot:6249529-Lingulodinium_polyedra.AAC.1
MPTLSVETIALLLYHRHQRRPHRRRLPKLTNRKRLAHQRPTQIDRTLQRALALLGQGFRNVSEN